MLGAKQDPPAAQRALGYLEEANSLGLDIGTVKSERLFRPLQDREEFKRLLARPPKAKPASPVLLVDPL
jgi:hypothetical protein